MNKSQELEVMLLRAEVYADEVIQKHESNWYSEEAREAKPAQPQEIKDSEDG